MKNRLFSIFILILGCTLSAFAWQHLTEVEQTKGRESVSSQGEVITREIKAQIQQHVEALIQMAHRWDHAQGSSYSAWHNDASNYIKFEKTYQSIEWVTKSYQAQWKVTQPGSEENQDKRLTKEASLNAQLDTARDERSVTIIKSEHSSPDGFRVYVPLYPNDQFDGFIVGTLNLDSLLELVLQKGHFDNPISLMERGQILFQKVPQNFRITDDISQHSLPFYNLNWQIYVWPAPTPTQSSTGFLPNLVLTFGLCISLLLSFSFYFSRQVENKKRQLEAKNKELSQKNRELANTHSQLVHSAKLASLGEMATGIAHELNQPLQVISMNAEMGPEYLAQGKKNRLVKSFADIINQVERAQSIIKQLRTFGRDSAQDEMSLVQTQELLSDSLLFLKRQFSAKNIEIRENMAPALPLIYCNKIQVEQVLLNLLINAKDAVEASDEKVIGIKAYQKDQQLLIEVYDTGTGIPEEQKEKIFEPFFTTKEVGKGTGLGLSISHAIITQHQGVLKVESKVGKGTNFIVQLPLTQPELAPEQETEKLAKQQVEFQQ